MAALKGPTPPSVLPSWIEPILERAAHRSGNRRRRRLAYGLIGRRLWKAGVGREQCPWPTYVYPFELKEAVRHRFPGELQQFPDPQHDRVVSISVEDLWRVSDKEPDGTPLPDIGNPSLGRPTLVHLCDTYESVSPDPEHDGTSSSQSNRASISLAAGQLTAGQPRS